MASPAVSQSRQNISKSYLEQYRAKLVEYRQIGSKPKAGKLVRDLVEASLNEDNHDNDSKVINFFHSFSIRISYKYFCIYYMFII